LSGNPTSLVLADLNGDGKVDLAVTVKSLVSSIQVFTNNGHGLFGANTTIAGLPLQYALTTAVVNNSGLNALILAGGESENKLTVLAPPAIVPPVLALTHPAAGTFIISWVSAATNFVLLTNNNLTTTNWFPANYPVTVNGTNQSATLSPAPPGKLFFRLEN
jgi:hypothetical protein